MNLALIEVACWWVYEGSIVEAAAARTGVHGTGRLVRPVEEAAVAVLTEERTARLEAAGPSWALEEVGEVGSYSGAGGSGVHDRSHAVAARRDRAAEAARGNGAQVGAAPSEVAAVAGTPGVARTEAAMAVCEEHAELECVRRAQHLPGTGRWSLASQETVGVPSSPCSCAYDAVGRLSLPCLS